MGKADQLAHLNNLYGGNVGGGAVERGGRERQGKREAKAKGEYHKAKKRKSQGKARGEHAKHGPAAAAAGGSRQHHGPAAASQPPTTNPDVASHLDPALRKKLLQPLPSAVLSGPLGPSLILPPAVPGKLKSTAEEQFVDRFVRSVLAGHLPGATGPAAAASGGTNARSNHNRSAGTADQVIASRLKGKRLVLDNSRRPAHARPISACARRRRAHGLTCKELKRLKRRRGGVADRCTYAGMLPVNAVWCDYMDQLLDSCPEPEWPECLLQADMHGATAEVVRCGSPEMIGVRGIMVQVTTNVYRIVGSDDVLTIVPKRPGTIIRLSARSGRVVWERDTPAR